LEHTFKHNDYIGGEDEEISNKKRERSIHSHCMVAEDNLCYQKVV